MGVPITKILDNSVVTTNATVTKIFSFDASTDGVYLINCNVCAFNETDGKAYCQELYRGFKRVSATVSALAASVNTFNFGDATITVTITNTGDELYVEVTGVAAKTIDWNITTVIKYT